MNQQNFPTIFYLECPDPTITVGTLVTIDDALVVHHQNVAGRHQQQVVGVAMMKNIQDRITRHAIFHR